MKLEIVYLDPHDLTPYENNTRKHSPEDIEQIKASMQTQNMAMLVRYTKQQIGYT